jgi:hypothetical protein
MVVGELIEESLQLIGGPMLADELPFFGGEGLRSVSAGLYRVVWKMLGMVITDAINNNILWTSLLVRGCGPIQQNFHSGRAKRSSARPVVRHAHHPERSRRGIQEAKGKQ